MDKTLIIYTMCFTSGFERVLNVWQRRWDSLHDVGASLHQGAQAGEGVAKARLRKEKEMGLQYVEKIVLFNKIDKYVFVQIMSKRSV